MRLVILSLLLLACAGGCASGHRGDTVIRIKNATWEERKIIRRESWRVSRAVEDVRVRYALDDIRVVVVITELGGLGESTPQLDLTASVRGATIVLNEQLFLDHHPDLDEILMGLLAHEMGHALHYARMSTADLATLGFRYGRAMRNPKGPHREFVRAYERLTDMMAIVLGYGDDLIYQKRASELNLARNDPPQVWDFYLTETEITAYMDDRSLLRRDLDEAIGVIGLPSFERLKTDPELDDDGDLIHPSRASALHRADQFADVLATLPGGPRSEPTGDADW